MRTLTIIFWNTWFHVQNGQRDNGQQLLRRLGYLIQEHEPDVLGLNEVLVSRHDGSSPVIDYLKSNGYFCHFAVISSIDADWLVGNLFASKNKPVSITEHVLGIDTQARRRGYDNCDVKAIQGTIRIGDASITILVNYLCSLLPADWGTHIAHRRNYEKLVGSIKNKNLIVGGDFNETKYMLPWLRLPRHLQRKTGTLFNPTWRLNGQKKYLAFANYDNMLYRKDGQLKLHTFKVLNRQPSDHAPLLAVFEVQPENNN